MSLPTPREKIRQTLCLRNADRGIKQGRAGGGGGGGGVGYGRSHVPTIISFFLFCNRLKNELEMSIGLRWQHA